MTASNPCCRGSRRACRRASTCTPWATSRSSSRPPFSASSARRRSPPRWSALMILDFPRQLAFDGHHPHRDSARHIVLADAVVVAGRDRQRHDAGRTGACRRHSGRRRNRHHREHQLPSRNGQTDRAGDHGRRPADRHPGLRDAALPVHRLRADVPARRRRRLPVPAAGRSRRLCSRRLVLAVAHAGSDHGQLSHARPSYRTRSRRAAATIAQPAQALSADVRRSLRASARSLSLAAVARACLAEDLHRRIPRLRRRLFRSLAVPRRELLPGGRFRADLDARARPARHPHRGDGAAVRPHRTEPSAAPSRPTSSTISSTISGCRFPASTWPIRTPARSARRTAMP